MGTRFSASLGSLLLLVVFASPTRLLSRERPIPPSPEWRILNALGRQARLEMQLRREGRFKPLAEAPPPAAADAADIAVIDDAGDIIVPANYFDLPYRSLRFTPDGSGYRVSAGGVALDSSATGTATLLALDDDDSRQVPIGFRFSFYGKSYSTVFVNSDGNLTFGSAEAASSYRDLARFLVGPPRIAPLFTDLNPADGGAVSYSSEPGRLVVTWQQVPECCAPPVRLTSTFQVVLYPDGSIQLAYGMVLSQSVVVGISPGNFTSSSGSIIDLSLSTGNQVIAQPIAEVFQPSPAFSETAAARKFYASHEDAYDQIVFWTNFPFTMNEPTAFAYELAVANSAGGIGLKNFDYSPWFGSAGRLSSFVLMGYLPRFPADPWQAVPGIQPKTTISTLGEESGHRWLAYLRYPFEGNPTSNVLLGRDNAHWSFFFNTDASVMEGTRLQDNGDGSFTSIAVVEHYSQFDQYVMGLRGPDEVAPSFLVTHTDFPDAAMQPRVGFTFHGARMEVNIGGVIAANGPRLPPAPVAEKNFHMAFVLINGKGLTATPEQIRQLDDIRLQFTAFWPQATDWRSQLDTRLLRALALRGLPAAALAPQGGVTFWLECAAASDVPRFFWTASSSPAVSLPGIVTLPAGARSVDIRATTNSPGTAQIRVGADAYETAEGVIAVASPADSLQVAAISGDGQLSLPSGPVSDPLVVEVRDANQLPVAGATVRFTASGGASVSPASAVTDGFGRAQAQATLGGAFGTFLVTASVTGGAQATFTLTAIHAAVVPPGSAVSGASFAPAPAPVSPGSIFSIFGSNLAVDTRTALSLPLPVVLGNTRVEINGIAAPLFYVSAGQINAQVPFEASGSTASLVVDNGGSRSVAISLPLASSVPGIFTAQYGTGPGAVLHTSDYSPVADGSPATSGEIVAIYCTGLGAVTPNVQSGYAAPPGSVPQVVEKPQVTIGGAPAEVLFAGLAPGFVGLYQVNVRVPAGLSGVSLPLVLKTSLASNTATLSVR
jgi:uncharacterized protein (TIGR03437 family)